MNINKSITHRPLVWFVATMLLLLPVLAHAQEPLKTLTLFEKFGERPNVTRVELNGEILRSYRMTTYKSLVFKDVTNYQKEVEECLKYDVAHSLQVKKSQEVTDGGVLRSIYYQLTPVKRKQRYLLFKRGKEQTAALIFIEGELTEQELMKMLYQKR